MYQFYESYLGEVPKHSMRWFASTNFQLPLCFNNYGFTPSMRDTTIEGIKSQTQGAFVNLHMQFDEVQGGSGGKFVCFNEVVQVNKID